MAEEDDGAEKSFDASPERIRQARQKGNVPQSPDLLTFARYSGLALGVIAVAGSLSRAMGSEFSIFLMNPDGASRALMFGGQIMEIFSPAAFLFVGLVIFSMIFAVVALIAQQSITFSTEKIKPDLQKLNPIKNAGKKFGGAAMIDFLKSLVKVTAVSIVGFVIAAQALPEMLASVGAPAAMLGGELQSLTSRLLFGAIVVAGVVAAIDVPLKWSQHRKKLRMSRQEIVDEMKELDGDPEQKRARQAQARSIAENRQIQDVPTADVVIVNPEHYAVALKWKRDGSEVPRCVAKGIDHMALRIKATAEKAGVPVYRNVPTARSLYATVEVGGEIQREHYEAVAAAIRFADGLKKAKKDRTGE